MQIATVTPSKRPLFWRRWAEGLVQQKRKPDYSILIIDHNELCPTLDIEAYLLFFGIKLIVVRNPDDNVALGNLLTIGFDEASKLIDDGLMCIVSDDDCYEELYLHEAVSCFNLHPGAAIIGKTDYCTRWMEGVPKNPVIAPYSYHISPVKNIAGSTIAISVKAWKENPTFRFSKTDWSGDISLKDKALELGLPIYSSSPYNFWYQRWPKSHGHIWNCPEDPS